MQSSDLNRLEENIISDIIIINQEHLFLHLVHHYFSN